MYQPLTFTPKIIYTNPTTSAVLTPTSQVVPTTSQVINMITEYAPQTDFSIPLKNTDGTVTLNYDATLKIASNKLSVVTDNLIKIDGSNKATSLLAYAAAVSAANDLDIPSYKNVKDYVSGNLGQKADIDFENVTMFNVINLGSITSNFTLTQDGIHKGNITASCALILPTVSAKFHNLLFDFTLASGVSLTIPSNISWNYSISPSLSNTLVNRFIFDTKDGGTTWKGYYAQFAGTL